jgi:cell division protein FtsL
VHPAVVTVVAIVAMVAVAVAFQAQQVSGQSQLDLARSEIVEERGRQQELRARVAAIESPARVLEAAEELGMIEPAPVVAVAAPVAAAVDTTAGGIAG